MLKKNLVLGSVATLAVAVAMSPAFAQSPPQYPDFSLPWEKAETSSLNAQQASEPGIIASTTTTSTSGVVASTDNSSDIVAYNEALADQQAKQEAYNSSLSDYNSKVSEFQSKESSYQQSWQDYQNKLNAYNQQMLAPAPSAAIVSTAPSAAIVSTAPSRIVSQEIINHPARVATVTEETITRPVVRDTFERRQVVTEQRFTQPVVHEETVMRPRTVWVPETRQVVRNETVTRPVVREEIVRRPVVTQEVVTRPVVREQIVERPVLRETIERPLASQTIVAANTPVVDEWVSIYPHHERLVVFNTVPGSTLISGIPVMDRMGNIVGSFQHMTVGDLGAQAVITLNDGRTVAVMDQHLRFDPMANMIVADLSYGQMDSMPTFVG